MRLIWTKSNLPLSLVIRAITGEDCSHFAFVFESKAKALVFESNLVGCHPVFLGSMTSGVFGSKIVHSMDLALSLDDENKIYDTIVEKYDGNAYDYLGALYLGYRILLKRIFKIALPEINAWSQKGSYYCDELYDVLTEIPSVPDIQVAGTMRTPHDLWVALNSKAVK